ncbi:glycosyltransferase family 4 protein [Marinilongibacter aquaticus]|uniref:glycosyltransferase family 4 protein n=1 Tax=Marinilongibacter aquaticus TaxID=2975157 RepID=UPI0021BDB7A8|nr:glycosyltransferase family 4 protein [Marinilongibacter aquaticus]UBM61023.1 glycosyltransferase family 4 protein [Marinilongibacter aquaticus]
MRIRGKKIIYIGGFELPDKNAAAHRVLSVGKILRSLDCEVIFFGISKNDKDFDDTKEVEGFKTFSVKYPQNGFEWLRYLTSVSRVCEVISLEEPDLIICYNYFSIPLFRLFMASRSLGFKVVGDISEWYLPNGNVFFRLLKSLDVNLRMRFINPKLDGLIVISDFLENYYQKHFNANMINLPPLIDFGDKKWRVAETTTISDRSLRLIFSGTLGRKKDTLSTLFRAIDNLSVEERKRVVLDIVGVTEEEFKKQSGSFNFNESGSIRFHGRVGHTEALRFLRNADFSIFFRENNLANMAGFPTKFVEAISSGVPVITNRSSNLEKYFKMRSIGFLLNDLSEESVLKVIRKALEMGSENIAVMKGNCKELGVFNFEGYEGEMGRFLSSLDL